MPCRVITAGAVRMWACRIDEGAHAIAERRRLEAEVEIDAIAELLGLVEVGEEHEEGADGCDWREDGDDELVEGDRLVEVSASWFDANLDDEASP
jgi:hypothetical protein